MERCDRLAAGWSCKRYPTVPAWRRGLYVAIGALVPVLLVVIGSGILTKLDEATIKTGYAFGAVTLLLFVVWLVIVVVCASPPDRSVRDYVESGITYQSTLFFGFYGLSSLLTKF